MSINRIQEFWPDWQIGKILGEGSYGKVYSAHYKRDDINVTAALKVISIPVTGAEFDALRSEGMSESETKKYFEGIVKDFINEIKVMNTLKGAPNIVAVEDFKILENTDRIGWNIFIRMELLKSFKSYLDEQRPTEEEVIKLGIDIATALEVCHERHIIHRDIKPANIFIDDFGNFKLDDFGIAKELEKTAGAASCKGTYTFMAPEVAYGKRYEQDVDIYSLGLVMYSLLNNNRPPFVDPNSSEVTYIDRKEANDKRLEGTPLPPPANASKTLSNIILTACAFDPAKRFKNATALKNALKNCDIAPKAPVIVPKNPKHTQTDHPKANNKPLNDETVMIKNIKPMSDTHKKNTENKTRKKKTGLLITIITLILALVIAGVVILPGILKSDNKNTKQTEALQNKELSQDLPPESYAGKNVIWSFADGVLTISGKGEMYNYYIGSTHDYDMADAPWEDLSDEIEMIVIEEGVTTIGRGAFRRLGVLKEISISNTVTSIGDYAFCDGSIRSNTIFEIPYSVNYIGELVFEDCELNDFVVNEKNEYFISVNGVLYTKDMTQLIRYPNANTRTYFEVPDSVNTISESAFQDCDNLEYVIIHNTVTSIGDYGFDTTIRCLSGSYAEQFAIENDIPYVLIDTTNKTEDDTIDPNTSVPNESNDVEGFISDNNGNIIETPLPEKQLINYGGTNVSWPSEFPTEIPEFTKYIEMDPVFYLDDLYYDFWSTGFTTTEQDYNNYIALIESKGFKKCDYIYGIWGKGNITIDLTTEDMNDTLWMNFEISKIKNISIPTVFPEFQTDFAIYNADGTNDGIRIQYACGTDFDSDADRYLKALEANGFTVNGDRAEKNNHSCVIDRKDRSIFYEF